LLAHTEILAAKIEGATLKTNKQTNKQTNAKQ